MTFTSDDMIRAANRYLKDLKVPVNFEERKQLKDGFFAGALWAASKMEEDDDNELDRLLREAE